MQVTSRMHGAGPRPPDSCRPVHTHEFQSAITRRAKALASGLHMAASRVKLMLAFTAAASRSAPVTLGRSRLVRTRAGGGRRADAKAGAGPKGQGAKGKGLLRRTR